MIRKSDRSSVSTRKNAPPVERRKRFCQLLLIGFVLMLAVVMPAAAAEVYIEVNIFSNPDGENGLKEAIARANGDPENHYKIGIVGIDPHSSVTPLSIEEPLEITGKVTLTPSQKDMIHWGTLLLRRLDFYENQPLFVIRDGGSLMVCGNVTQEKNTGICIEGSTNCEGSLVYVENNGKFTLNGRIVGGKAENGAAVYVDGGTFFMIGGAIQGNTATENGGGVYIDNDGFFEMTTGAIGGGNNAKNGAGVYVKDGRFTMSGGTIVDNTATENGGGVYVNSDSHFEMTGGNIWRNNQAVNGAGVYINDGYLNLVKGTIEGNTATVDGGGLYLANGAVVTMEGGTLQNNNAEYGGGVYIHDSSFEMRNAETTPTISNNNAKHGGGVYVNGGEGLKLFGGLISGNIATQRKNEAGTGGAIYISKGSVHMGMGGETETGGTITITQNTADKGSAIYATPGTTFTMKAGEIKSNNAGLSGFAVCIDKATLNLINGKITDNKAGLFGGVYVDGKVILQEGSAAQITGNSGGNLLLYGDTTITIQGILNDNTRIGIAHTEANTEERVLVAHGEEGDVPNYIAGYVEKLFFSDIADYRIDEDGRAVFIVYDPPKTEPKGSSTWIQAPGGSYGLYTGTVNNGGTVNLPGSSPVQQITLPEGMSGDVIVSTQKDQNLPTPTEGTVYKQFDLSTTAPIPYGTTASIGITIPASDLPQGQGVLVLHYQGAERGWVAEPSTATKNGDLVHITTTVSGLSPFAIVFDETGVIPTEAVSGDVAPPLENPGVVATPAESSAPVVGVLAGLLAGLAVLRRK